MNRSTKEKKENAMFIFVLLVLFGLLFMAIKFSHIEARADEIVVAEAPFNVVGGSNENSVAGSIIDISDGGSDQSVQSPASNILYAPGASDGTDFVLTIESSDDPVDSSDESNNAPVVDSQTNIIRHGEIEPNTSEVGQEVEVADIYVPDSDDDCPVSAAVRLPVEVQEYIWNKCKKVTGDYKNYYAFILGAIELESDFKRTAIHYNDNGSVDRGLMQINSCNIKSCKRAGLITCTDDLWDIYKNIDCGFHEMNDYVKKFGVCESAYYAYNTGRQNGGSNKNSRIVMQNMSKWNTILFG